MHNLRIALLYILTLTFSGLIFQVTDARSKKPSIKKKEKVCLFQYRRYEFNPTYFSKFLWEIKSNNTTMDFEMTIRNDVVDDVWVDFGLFTQNRKTLAWNKMFAFDLNGCELLSPAWTRKFNIFNVWLLNAMKYGNVSLSCPVRAAHYALLNMKPEKVSISPFMGIYRVDSIFYKRLENNSRDILSNNSFACDIRMQ